MIWHPLTLVPARTGSVRVPNKNFRPIHGTTLTERTVKCARLAGLEPIIITDRTEPELYGCHTFYQNSDPDGDWPQLYNKLHAAIEVYVGDPVVMLQPTAALRSPIHVRWALSRYEQSVASSCVSIVAGDDGWGERDGTFYIFGRSILREFNTIYGPTCLMLTVSPSLNINTTDDWAQLEALEGEALREFLLE